MTPKSGAPFSRREAASAFSDATVYVEKLLERPRHIEVQIFGDGQGEVIHLQERECSIQRRHQKVVEEAPAIGISDALRSRICAAAVTAGKAVGYSGAGTVEFMVDEAELSTRIEVLEHIPGVSNLWPDALSRLWAPEPKEFPRALAGVPRTECPARGSDFWVTLQGPSVARGGKSKEATRGRERGRLVGGFQDIVCAV